jgi:membrane protein
VFGGASIDAVRRRAVRRSGGYDRAVHGPAHLLSRLSREARALSPRDAVRLLLQAYDENDLLTFASAISFRVLFSIIPLALFALGLLGGFGLDAVWTRDVAPQVADSTSRAAFRVVDQTVREVLGQRQLFWVTFGAVIAVWGMSGAMRAVMDVLDRVYECRNRRGFWARMRASVVLAMVVGALLLTATALMQVAPLLVPHGVGGAIVRVIRWPLDVALLLGAIGLLLQFGPSSRLPMGWVTFGSLLSVVAWVATSLAFTWYLTSVADYGSVYGNLATVIVVMEFLYLSSIAFLTGVQLDAIVRDRMEGHPSGDNGDGERPDADRGDGDGRAWRRGRAAADRAAERPAGAVRMRR